MNILDTSALYEIGTYLSEKLNISNNTLKDVKLTLCVEENYFKKLDEDIFYKIIKKNEEDKQFIPSENEIILTFPNNTITIKKCATK